MPTPDFILELRRHVGTAPLPLVGVTAVILREGRVLLGRRSDTGALTPITGIVDPGEEPAVAAAREAHEEADVRIRVDRLAWVHQVPRVTYANGDRADYLDLTFRCTWLTGEPFAADGEMTDLGWHHPADLRAVGGEHRRRIETALAVGDGPARFEVG
ncbi:NUDIX domain-containing protein [Agromyces tropicus]|uniref:NUDIX domain-containing protein n=1 Tax=Agromyces tropicus TaxID=555371 RepID=A0ABN2USP7_9MICO